jgi:lipopolysaccharide export system protein LptA
MRRSQATRYARWSALTALLIVVIVFGIYARRAWQQVHALRKAPPGVSVNVTQQLATFSYSKMEGERTLFTVRASHATEFKQDNKNLLEDVWITVYGRTGGRVDNLHTQRCDYLSNTGQVVCKGEVQIDLESAEEARQPAAQGGIRVVTSNLSFDRETGDAHSDQPVTFRFPQGQGRAVGVNYSSKDAALRLLAGVELSLREAGPKKPRGRQQPLEITAANMEYRSERRTLGLGGPVHVRSGTREMTAGLLMLELSPALRARRVIATQRPQIISSEPQGHITLAADTITSDFAADGSTEKIIAQGNVRGTRRSAGKGSVGSAAAEDNLQSGRLEVEFATGSNQPKVLSATGNVNIDSSVRPAGVLRRIQTESLRAYFSPAGRSGAVQLARAETLAAAMVEFSSERETTRLRGERLQADYGRQNRLERIIGRQGIEVERDLPGRPPQVMQSQEGTVEFGAQGDWSEVKQSGKVRFREAERTAHADHAHLLRAAQTLTLSRSAMIADAQAETSAATIVFNQSSGVITADGGVRTSYRKAEAGGVTNLAPQPAHITAQQLVAGRDSGQALYSGSVRLWQGDAVIEGDTLELRRSERILLARGNVRALIPQRGPPVLVSKSRSAPGAISSSPTGASGRTIWLVRAGRLTYWSAPSVVLLEENVRAESAVARIEAHKLELTLGPGGNTSGKAGGNTAGEFVGGAQQLTRALATGGVTIRQEDRRGTAERAEYLAADGKFVLSGGNPALTDASQNTVTGRQLTFFLADDRILVESSEGTRTLTRHRIQ